MFVGRSDELAFLNAGLARRTATFVPIYGRRRVGKTELILRFMEGKGGVFLEGKQAPVELQQRELLAVAAVSVDPQFGAYATGSWKDLLARIVEHARRPFILALDEFQWMVEASPELPSILKELWDRRWKKLAGFCLIVCGSYIGFMEREVLGAKSPLYGRRTGQLLLGPLSFRSARELVPRYGLQDAARIFFLGGGIPAYLEAFDDGHSVEANIKSELLDVKGQLFNEPAFLLREELRDVQNYHAILMALGTGPKTARELARALPHVGRSIHYHLGQLAELGYIEKRYPLGPRKPAAQKVVFAVSDPVLQFWFRFVFPNISLIRQKGPKDIFQRRVRPELASYFGHRFESLCRAALPTLAARDGSDSLVTVGSYWTKTTQIDVVGRHDDGVIDIGECKWGTVRSPGRLEAEVLAKVATYPLSAGETVVPRLFVVARPRRFKAAGSVRWHDLEDLYGVRDEPGRT